MERNDAYLKLTIKVDNCNIGYKSITPRLNPADLDRYIRTRGHSTAICATSPEGPIVDRLLARQLVALMVRSLPRRTSSQPTFSGFPGPSGVKSSSSSRSGRIGRRDVVKSGHCWINGLGLR